MGSAMPDRECLLAHAVDSHERCPGGTCPFWKQGRCRLDHIRADLDTSPELATFLLGLRARMMPGEGWRPLRRVGHS